MYALLNLPQAVVQQTYYVTLALLNEPSPLITHWLCTSDIPHPGNLGRESGVGKNGSGIS